MAAQKLRVLIAVVAAMVLILAAGVAYANGTQDTTTGAGNNGAQVAGNDDSDGPGDSEEPGDADEAGDFDGPGDTED
jgi:hypothetical protein